MSAVGNFFIRAHERWAEIHQSLSLSGQSSSAGNAGAIFYPDPHAPHLEAGDLDRDFWAALAEAKSNPIEAAAVVEMNAAYKAVIEAAAIVATGGSGNEFERANQRFSVAHDALRAWAVVSEVVPAVSTRPADSPAIPVKLLANWREILIALGMKNNREDKQTVFRLNKTYDGPIVIPGAGKQPIADKAKLVAWWNRLTIELQDAANRAGGGNG